MRHSHFQAEFQLARVEARRLVFSPLFCLSMLGCAWWLRMAAVTDNAEDEYNLLSGFSLILTGYACCVLVAFAALRSRRAGTDELVGTTPVDPARRTIGHGLALLAPGVLAVIWMGVQVAVLRPGHSVGNTTHDTVPPNVAIPRPNIGQMAQGSLAIIAVGALMLALVLWVPTWLFTLAFVIPVLMQLTWFGVWAGTSADIGRWLTPWSRGWVNGPWMGERCDSGGDCILALDGFDGVTPWWHLGYLAALAALFVAVAVIHDRRDRNAWLALGASATAVVGFIVIQAVVARRFDPDFGVR